MRYADSFCTYTEDYRGDEHHYVYTGRCVMTRKPVTVRVKASELYAYRQGKLIQHALKSNTKGECEFLMSGMSEAAFDAGFKDENEATGPDGFVSDAAIEAKCREAGLMDTDPDEEPPRAADRFID